jgi:hypothetical protein
MGVDEAAKRQDLLLPIAALNGERYIVPEHPLLCGRCKERSRTYSGNYLESMFRSWSLDHQAANLDNLVSQLGGFLKL